MKAADREREYVLGTDRAELERLRFQHQAWVEQGYALWAWAGLRAGDAVLDLGCGPGFTSLELATVVGPTGRVIALDESRRFLAHLESEVVRLGLANVETLQGRAEDVDLPAGSLDAAYGRWILCWIPAPGAVLQRVARALRSGGKIVLQEYVDWAAMSLLPRSETFDAAVAACMRSWELAGPPIDVGREIPELAERSGLVLETFRPVARIGRVGSLEWRWLEQFFRGYLPKTVEHGLLRREEMDAMLREWERRSAEGISCIATPTMVDVVLRKP